MEMTHRGPAEPESRGNFTRWLVAFDAPLKMQIDKLEPERVRTYAQLPARAPAIFPREGLGQSAKSARFEFCAQVKEASPRRASRAGFTSLGMVDWVVKRARAMVFSK